MNRYTIDATALIKGSATVVVEAETEEAALQTAQQRLERRDATYTIGDRDLVVPAGEVSEVANLEIAARHPSPSAALPQDIYVCDFDVRFPGPADVTHDIEGAYGADYVAETLREYTRMFNSASPLADWSYGVGADGNYAEPTKLRGTPSEYHAHLRFFVHGSSAADALRNVTHLLVVMMKDSGGEPPFTMVSPRDVPRAATADEIAALEIPENDPDSQQSEGATPGSEGPAPMPERLYHCMSVPHKSLLRAIASAEDELISPVARKDFREVPLDQVQRMQADGEAARRGHALPRRRPRI